jgi:hypothetical protein
MKAWLSNNTVYLFLAILLANSQEGTLVLGAGPYQHARDLGGAGPRTSIFTGRYFLIGYFCHQVVSYYVFCQEKSF